MGDLVVKDICLVKLLRNAYYRTEQADCKKENSNTHKFYLFDYFDSLSYVKNEDIDAASSFGIVDAFNDESIPSTVSQLISLVKYDGQYEGENLDNPFEYKGGSDDNNLSDRPFFAFISISIKYKCLKPMLGQLPENLKSYQRCDINDFLLAALEELSLIVESKDESYISKPIISAFQLVNAGDFCVAIRSAHINDIHKIAMKILNLHNTRDESFCKKLGDLQYRIYTVVGVEYAAKKAFGLNNKHAEDDEININLRISARPGFYKELESLKCSSIKVAGVFGNYEIAFNIKLKVFKCVYPYLCAFKFHTLIDFENSEEFQGFNLDDNEKEFVCLLRGGLKDNQITSVSERVFSETDNKEFSEMSIANTSGVKVTELTKIQNDENDVDIGYIKSHLHLLKASIADLEKRGSKLTYHKSFYKDSIRCCSHY